MTLFNNALLQILGQVGADFGSGAFSGNFGNIMFNHDFDKLLETSLGGVPAKFCLRFSWIAPEIYYVGRTVEVRRNPYDYVAGFQLRVES